MGGVGQRFMLYFKTGLAIERAICPVEKQSGSVALLSFQKTKPWPDVVALVMFSID